MPATRPPAVGSDAPMFDLPDLDGNQWSLRDHLQQPLLVSFLRHAG